MEHINTARAFIKCWQGVTTSELATAQSFVMELCGLLGVGKPHPTPAQDYVFERPVTFAHGDGTSTPGRIDCYRRGHFVLEAKKLKAGAHTKGFDDGLLRARPAQPCAHQRSGHVRGVAPPGPGRPPLGPWTPCWPWVVCVSAPTRSGPMWAGEWQQVQSTHVYGNLSKNGQPVLRVQDGDAPEQDR